MRKRDLVNLLLIFLTWRVLLLIIVFVSTKLLPASGHFLGGGSRNYAASPFFWSAANFDGEHYLSIAQFGYKPLQYFYFPLFPFLVRLAATVFDKNIFNLVKIGLFLNHIFFFISIIGIWKLAKDGFNKSIAYQSVIFLLVFPTSFYFISFYTESLFLMLVVWSFYFVKSGKWLLAGVLGGLSTATRVVGLALVPAFFATDLKNKVSLNKLFGVLFIPAGILVYMYFLNQKTGDPLEFFNTLSLFGGQRSAGLVPLPQVFYRYLFKIIPNLNPFYFLGTFPILLEFGTAILFLILSVVSFLKMKLEYAVYLSAGYLIPTFSGSFSSLPRYVLVLFPAFILLSILLNKGNNILKVFYFLTSAVLLTISFSLFAGGYWLS